jgi:hypothetical protein
MRRILAVFIFTTTLAAVLYAQDDPYETDYTENSRYASGLQHEADDDPFNRWLYTGLRGGGSLRFYTLPEFSMDYYSNVPDLSYEASFHIAFKFLPFMSIQAEAVYTRDRARFRRLEYNQDNDKTWFLFYTDSYISASLLFPITLKFPLVFDHYIISPLGGVYWALPLGNMTLDSNIPASKIGEFYYDLTGSFGLTVGVDLGIRLGPGILFLDVRYGCDLGETFIKTNDENLVSYQRVMASFSIGYELALVDKR